MARRGTRRADKSIYTSRGPEDLIIRGSALSIYKEYMHLAKTAIEDTLLAEAYTQHAEHYGRLLSTEKEQIV